MSDLNFSFKLNFDTKQARSNLQSFESAFAKGLRSIGQSQFDVGMFRQLVKAVDQGKVAIRDLDAETLKLLKTYNTNRSVASARDMLGLRDQASVVRDIKQIRQAYDTLRVSGKLTSRELSQASVVMRERIRALRRETNDWSGSLNRMHGELIASTAVLAGIAYGLGRAGDESLKFGRSMAEVSTLLDDTSGMAQLTQRVRALTREYGSDVNVNAKALYDIISAGATDSADAMTELDVANQLAIGGVTDVSTAADGLTSVLNAYNLSAKDAVAVSDAFFTAVRQGKTTVPELSASIGQLAPLASTAGVSLDEMLSAVAALTASGLKTPVAITGLRSAISNIIKPQTQAAKLAQQLGLEFDAEALKARGLAGFLADVRRATGGNVEQMGQLFGSVEGLNAVLALTGPGAQKFGETLRAMGEKAGATDAAVAKMMDAPAQRVARFKAALQNVQLTLGDTVTAFTPLLESVASLLNAFNDLPAPLRSTIAASAALATSIVPVALAINSISKAAGVGKLALVGLLNPLQQVNKEAPAAAAAAGGLARNLSLLSAIRFGMWGVVIAQISRLAAAMSELKKVQESVSRENSNFIESQRALIAVSGEYKNIQLVSADALNSMTADEIASYRQRLAAAERYWRAQRDLQARLDVNTGGATGTSSQAALDAQRELRVHQQYLQQLDGILQKRQTDEADFAARIETIKKQETAAIKSQLASQISAYRDAQKQLETVQAARKAIESDFASTQNLLTNGVPKPIDQQNFVDLLDTLQTARGSLQEGDLKTAISQAQQARQVIEALFRSGKESAYSLQPYLDQARKIADDAAKAEETSAQAQVGNLKKNIEQLVGSAEFLKSLTIGFDEAKAKQSAEQLRAEIEAMLAKSPIKIPVQLDKQSSSSDTTEATKILAALPAKAGGGEIVGPGTGTSDSVLMYGSAGEYMQSARAVRHYGVGFMEAINQLKLPKFASGGLVGAAVSNLPSFRGSGAIAAGGSGDTYYLQIPGGGQVGPLSAPADVGADLRRLFSAQARKQGRSKA
ncbi:MAG: phage tail tape measure protein [Acidihalobacter sp.]|uniref:phage tail tape measure protein n=1 Tax=Acidihalobacter sp. TaxID=1872108 RepID=UPI00307D8444